MNPIHGLDLAKFCVNAIEESNNEMDIGGPEIFTMEDIAEMAFQVQGKKSSILHNPDFVRKLSLFLIKRLPEKLVGAAEFF